MDAQKAADNLKVIRQLMERPIRYSTMSGISGIFAGCCAIVGLALDWIIWSRGMSQPRTTMWLNLAVWAGVFVVAFVGVATLTVLREKRQGIPLWSPGKRRFLLTILPAFVASVGLTAVIVYRWYGCVGPNQWGLIPAIWMICYGLACWEVGAFSIPEIRVMGAAFILAALAAGLWQMHPYLALGATFGGFHLVYGAVVWARHGG